MEIKIEKKVYDVNNLIDVIKDYSLNLHKTTFRYGIDYIKCDKYLKEKHPKIFKELEDYFIPRKVIFIYNSISDSTYPIKTLIEIGNKYELETMIGVPKAIITPINENEYECKIEDLTWVLLENLTENEINDYKSKLTLSLNIVDYSWLNENKIDEIIELIDRKITTDKFIDNLKSNKSYSVISSINKLNLEERLTLADKFNSEIKEDCLNTIKDVYLDTKLTEIERHNWLNCLCVIPTELLRITHNKNEYKIYI